MNAYKQIDFGRESFSPGVGKIIPGLYDRIEESEKVILWDDWQLSDVDQKPVILDFAVSGTKYVAGYVYYTGTRLMARTITVSSDDVVTIRDVEIAVAT